MGTVLLFCLLFLPQLGSVPSAPAPAAVRTEKLTASESRQWNEAKAAVAEAQAKLERAKAADGKTPAAKTAEDDAQARLDQANRELQGAEDGISLAHHANTECGCYVQSQGREFDRIEFKDDTIIIRHVHEAPVGLH